jgi:hypothetical protein
MKEEKKIVGYAIKETIDDEGETIGYPLTSPSWAIYEGNHIYETPKRESNGKLKETGGEQEVSREKNRR